MSMVPFTPLPDQSRRIAELTQELEAAETRGDRLEAELKAERRKNTNTEKGVAELRKLLAPFYQWLGVVFGHIDSLGISDAPQTSSQPSSADPRKTAVWDSWVEKLGGKESFAGKMIVALLQHGALTSKQIAIHIGTKRMQTVYETTLKVNKAGILDKNGDRFLLKEL
jgi:hypothetical protein